MIRSLYIVCIIVATVTNTFAAGRICNVEEDEAKCCLGIDLQELKSQSGNSIIPK